MRLLFIIAFVITSLAKSELLKLDTEQKKKDERAAKVIETVIFPDTLFGQVVSKQLDQYFTSEEPWGLSSLFTLRMHLSSTDSPNLEADELKMQMFFAALLPEGLNDIVVKVMEAFSTKVLQQKPLRNLDTMLNVYLYVHFNILKLQPELLQLLNQSKPNAKMYKVVERFRKMYPRERLEEYFFTNKVTH